MAAAVSGCDSELLSGNSMAHFEQWSNEKQSGILNDYAILQYNNLVDKKHRIKNFFADISKKALE